MKLDPTVKPLMITDETFEREVLESNVPVLVDFGARWCGPCRVLSPKLEDLATDYEGRIKVAKLDIDENPLTTNEFGVRSIPTLVVIRDGEVSETAVGSRSKAELVQLIDRNIEQ